MCEFTTNFTFKGLGMNNSRTSLGYFFGVFFYGKRINEFKSIILTVKSNKNIFKINDKDTFNNYNHPNGQ